MIRDGEDLDMWKRAIALSSLIALAFGGLPGCSSDADRFRYAGGPSRPYRAPPPAPPEPAEDASPDYRPGEHSRPYVVPERRSYAPADGGSGYGGSSPPGSYAPSPYGAGAPGRY